MRFPARLVQLSVALALAGCGDASAPAADQQPAAPAATPATGTLSVDITSDTLTIQIGTRRIAVLSDGGLGPALDEPSLAGLVPTAQLSIDGSVTGERFFAIAQQLVDRGWTDLQVEIPTADGPKTVTLEFPSFCGCLAEEPERICVHPEVTLTETGATVGYFPARAGPCRNAVRQAKDADAPRADREPALDGRHVVVGEGGARVRPILDTGADTGALETTLRRTYALAPGCPYATLLLDPKVPWRSVEQVLARMKLGLGWSVTIAPAIEREDQAELDESSLPDPWTGTAEPVRETCLEPRGG